jgi:hypothetical protein
MKFLKLSSFAALLSLACVAQATTLTLPTANEMSAGTYNGFTVYSLDILQQCAAAGDPRCLPTSGLPVQSSPGQISDQAVVLAGSSGNNLENMPNPFPNGSAVDDPFVTPSGNGATFSITDAGGGFVGDQVDRWDISLSLLAGFIGNNNLVFLFDNNQQGSGANQWLNVWAQARIVDAAGNTISNLCFELNTNSGCNATPPAPADYVPVIGNFCVDKTTGAGYNIGTASNANDCGANGYFVENNLSTSNAEFAVFNQTLNDAVKNLANMPYFLSLDVRYIGQNAGQEQLWICSDCNIAPNRNVPEPASLPLVLMGFAAAGMAARKARRNS